MSTDDATGRTPKRQRTEDPRSASAATRHQEHWYRDGSIVLHVQDMLFRVHQTTLEKLSEVFKDLFSVPQPLDDERIDGCPAVRLEGDHGVDWVHLLDAIYDPLHFDELASQRLEVHFVRLSSILRLSTKYRIISFRRKAIAIFSKNFQSGDTYIPDEQREASIDDACAMIDLARSTNALTLLPFAFVSLTWYRRQEPIDDAPISDHDKLVVFRGMLRLLFARNDDMFPFAYSFDSPDGCSRSNSCVTVIGDFFTRRFRTSPHSSFFFASDKFPYKFSEPICEACLNHIRAVFRDGRQKTWERLPAIFDLGKDWDEIRRIEAYDSTP
ncbi:uncharacterized protein SCHCODRAFT_02547540 [Schizophyllum commune H4-8]|uniref:BTB domain-containing protein n=1 Tax=Schizophyllum commune (strain H4-8 / FGSC 9210) TaxID=578458 RepID=D8Q911_SCHCM|nr:uncharacterized protein SCHCODRAFT_02547540 [Schizophyllum commune H4-8]KAI5890591.1 hypothetical protein SCHCODRAFT_02547540 [Schizophyllum commune H4-8]